MVKTRLAAVLFLFTAFTPVASAQIPGVGGMQNVLVGLLVLGGIILITYWVLNHRKEDVSVSSTEADLSDLISAAKEYGRKGLNALKQIGSGAKKGAEWTADTLNEAKEKVKEATGFTEEFQNQQQMVESELKEALDAVSTGALTQDDVDDLVSTMKDLEMKKRAVRKRKKGKIVRVRNMVDDYLDTFDDTVSNTDELSADAAADVRSDLVEIFDDIDDWLLGQYQEFQDRFQAKVNELNTRLHDEDADQSSILAPLETLATYIEDEEMPFQVDNICGDYLQDAENMLAEVADRASSQRQRAALHSLREDLADLREDVETVIIDREKRKATAIRSKKTDVEDRLAEQSEHVQDVMAANTEMLDTVAEAEEALAEAENDAAQLVANAETIARDEAEHLETASEQVREAADTITSQRGQYKPLDADMEQFADQTVAAADTLPRFEQYRDVLTQIIEEQEDQDVTALENMLDDIQDAVNQHRTNLDTAYDTYASVRENMFESLLAYATRKRRDLDENLLQSERSSLEDMGETLQTVTATVDEAAQHLQTIREYKNWIRQRLAADADVLEDLHNRLAERYEEYPHIPEENNVDDAFETFMETLTDCIENIEEARTAAQT